MSHNVRVEILDITPDMAAKFLGANLQNRTISKTTVKAYSDDMKAGRWQLTNQGVAFYENGVLADGQHRLLAIVNSGVTVPMIVTKGLKHEAVTGIDQHRARTARDAVNIASGYTLSVQDSAIIRLTFNEQRMTAAKLEYLVPKVNYELGVINKWFKGANKLFQNAAIKSAILIMYLRNEDEQKLHEFCEILFHGIRKNPHDQTVILLRENIMFNMYSSRSGADREDMIKRVQWVFNKFKEQKHISRVANPKELLYARPQQ